MKSKKRHSFPILLLLLASCSSSKFTTVSENPFQISIYSIACSNAPLVKVKIEGTEYLLIFDLGCNMCLMLKDRVLNTLNHKEYMGISRFFDINGNIYEQSEYKIPHMQIGPFDITDIGAIQESYFFIQEGNKIGTKRRPLRTQDQMDLIDGKIGGGLLCLSKLISYFDLSHSTVCMGTRLDQITKNHPLSDFSQLKLEVINGFICLNLLTDRGMQKFLLDTGASHSLIQKTALDNKDVKINLELFGARRFIAIDLPVDAPFDGILGLDFFKDYKVCLDFSNQTLYIKSAHP